MTSRRKALFALVVSALFFLIATRFGTMLRPSDHNVRDVLNLAYDPLLLPQLQVDAVYGSALDGGIVAVFHTNTGYGWQEMRPQRSTGSAMTVPVTPAISRAAVWLSTRRRSILAATRPGCC